MDTAAQKSIWPLWKKIIFRFVFIYLALQIAPWKWFSMIGRFANQYYDQFISWAVTYSNNQLFHVRPVLVPTNGSGDTSFGWAELWLYLTVAAVGCLIWSVLDRKRPNYTVLNYWLCLFARYHLITFLFIYGVIKIFALQMIFPSLHILATPLGDLLPMRFAWYFIGYSTPYQVFSGIMEVTAALLLIYRRTATLGVLLAAAVFTNVMMLNLCYDIPVKIFSTQLVFVCLVLLANESQRIICFFVLGKPAAQCSIYQFNYTQRWMRGWRVVFKSAFILLVMGPQVLTSIQRYKYDHTPPPKLPVKNGVYEPVSISINNKDVPLLLIDTLLWQDMILENGGGSIKTGERIFQRKYNRAYFAYTIDSANHTFTFKQNVNGTLVDHTTLNYALPDSNTLKLWGLKNTDSVSMVFRRTKRHFQLAERQFHWLTEQNR